MGANSLRQAFLLALLPSLAMSACAPQPKEQATPAAVNPQRGEVLMGSKPPWFWRAFQPGVVMRDPDLGDVTFEQRDIGAVLLPSGRLVVGDVLVDPELPPLAEALKPGRYLVEVAIGHLPDGDQRIGAARIRLTDVEPIEWFVAMRAGQVVGSVAADDVLFGVDSGNAAFLSAEAAAHLATTADDKLYQRICDAMDANYVHTRSWVDFRLDPASGLNVVVFSAGLGDGSYPVYVGVGPDGTAACIVTEFGVGNDGGGSV